MYCINSTRIRFSEKTTDQERYNAMAKIYDTYRFGKYSAPTNFYQPLGGGVHTFMPMVINYKEEYL